MYDVAFIFNLIKDRHLFIGIISKSFEKANLCGVRKF